MKREKAIQEELKELAPFLASLEKKNHFIIPEGYFEENEEKLLEIVLIDEKIKKVQKLAGNRVSAIAPAGYFEALPSRIVNRIKQGDEIRILSIERTFNWKQWIQIAAAVIAVVIMGFPIIKNNFTTRENVEIALQKVSDDELNNYLSENTVALNEEELASQVSIASLEKETNKITAEGVTDVDETQVDVSQIDLNDIQNL